jgi:phage terminase small subunit
MPDISIHELEAAINFWRARSPSSGDELSLCKEASALSKPYALLIVQRQPTLPPQWLDAAARDAWETYVRMKGVLTK